MSSANSTDILVGCYFTDLFVWKEAQILDKKTVTVLLIEDSPDYAELVQDWLAADTDEVAFILHWTDSLASGLHRLAQGDIDVILMDLGLPDSNGPETFTKVRSHDPGIPVIVLSASDSESLALQLVQQGAADYLVKNNCTHESLVRAVQFSIARYGGRVERIDARGPTEKTNIIGILGAKGGVGTSTVACNLASELRNQTGKKVLVADLDIHAGLLPFLMSVQPTYSLADAISHLGRLDRTRWGTIITESTGGVDIISSPQLFGSIEFDAANLRQVVRLVQPLYQWIVLDLGRLNSTSASLLDTLTEVFVIGEMGIPALYETKRVLGALERAGVERERIRLVFNKAGDSPALSRSELKNMFGIPVYAELQADNREMQMANAERRLPSEVSKFRKGIGELARRVAGLPFFSPKDRSLGQKGGDKRVRAFG